MISMEKRYITDAKCNPAFVKCNPAFTKCNHAFVKCTPAFVKCNPANAKCNPAFAKCYPADAKCYPANVNSNLTKANTNCFISVRKYRSVENSITLHTGILLRMHPYAMPVLCAHILSTERKSLSGLNKPQNNAYLIKN